MLDFVAAELWQIQSFISKLYPTSACLLLKYKLQYVIEIKNTTYKNVFVKNIYNDLNRRINYVNTSLRMGTAASGIL